MQEEETVEIPLEYLTSLHVLLNKTFDKLKEVLGESAAMMFFTLAASPEVLESVGSRGDIDFLGGKLSKRLEGFGYDLEQVTEGDSVVYRLRCPYAAKIHPHLDDGSTYCPMSQMVLGLLRKQHKKTVLTDSKLRGDGATFTIRLQDE